MEILSIVPIFYAIFAFCLVVFVHELGHYLVAKWCGIKSTDFSIGFGPELFSKIDKNGTKWKICLIPLGGYVKFVQCKKGGKINIKDKSFDNASVFKRTLTVAAGPISNFILAFLLFFLSAFISGVGTNDPIIGKAYDLPGVSDFFEKDDKIISINDFPVNNFSDVFEISSNNQFEGKISVLIERKNNIKEIFLPFIFQPIVLAVETLSPASKAGLKPGDVFISIGNKKINNFEDIRNIVLSSKGEELEVKIWRKNEIINLKLTPELRPTETGDGNLIELLRIGVRGGPPFEPIRKTPGILMASKISLNMTFYVIKMSIIGIVKIIDNTISPKHLNGPIGVAKALTETSYQGFAAFISLVGAISAGLGLINLFPIPVLDGGYLMIFLYEAIFKKRPPEKVLNFLMFIGLFLILSIMVFATFNDLMR